MAGRGRPKIIELELTTENKQAILDYIKQGMSLLKIKDGVDFYQTEKKVYLFFNYFSCFKINLIIF